MLCTHTLQNHTVYLCRTVYLHSSPYIIHKFSSTTSVHLFNVYHEVSTSGPCDLNSSTALTIAVALSPLLMIFPCHCNIWPLIKLVRYWCYIDHVIWFPAVVLNSSRITWYIFYFCSANCCPRYTAVSIIIGLINAT